MAVGSALLVVTTKQLVHAALWLVVAFGALAGCYLVLTAEFVAWVQVLIYVGAVIVLLLFGIMLTRAPVGRSTDLDSGNRVAAAVVALATAGVLVTVVIDGFRTAYAPLTPGAGAASALGGEHLQHVGAPFRGPVRPAARRSDRRHRPVPHRHPRRHSRTHRPRGSDSSRRPRRRA
ncbi:NADH-quinone oxidoreductase subunit J [Nonomuraea ferruginea]